MNRVNKLVIFMALSVFVFNGYSQGKSKKEIREEKKVAQQRLIEELINSKTFVFVATRVVPSKGRSIDLSTNSNFVKFAPEQIEGDMPFFGRSFSGGTGDNAGIVFNEKPEMYTIDKKSKNFQVKAKVKGKSDQYQLSMVIGFGGSASLMISSNKKSTITYYGEITGDKQ